MTENQKYLLKIILFLQIMITFLAYTLIHIFLSPDSNQLWWLPSSRIVNFMWGAAGAVILLLPVTIYTIFRSNQLQPGLKPLFFLCRQPLSILVVISLLAGLGEELLFRGFIQEFMGLWWAAVLFLIPHIGFPLMLPFTVDKIFFSIFYLGTGLLLGLLAREVGLAAAITAHSLYDLSAFILIKKKYIHSNEMI